jgi:hypothetical protein
MPKGCYHILRQCENCGSDFDFNATPHNMRRGLGRFCSLSCLHQSNTTSVIDRVCEECGKSFRFKAYPSRLQQGFGRYCSRDCYHKARTIPFIDRFLSFVGPKDENGCILWTGHKNANGYGQISEKIGEKPDEWRFLLAHRVAYETAKGPIPEGLELLHSCDTPACINVEHLRPGTHAENMADSSLKGRMSRGSRNPRAKLDESDIIEIRRRFADGGILQRELAAEYGIVQSAVSDILNFRKWKHLIE